VNIREPVKMMLGQALAPSAYSIGFRHLHDVIKTAFGSAGQVQVKAQATLFVDQVIHILKLVLEAPLETPDELSQLTDFEALVLDLLKYVSQLLPSLATLVIKKKACELMELAMDKKSAIPFRAEFKWRNQVTEIIIEWYASSSFRVIFDLIGMAYVPQDERLCERDEGEPGGACAVHSAAAVALRDVEG
jgi:hypothetical protein